jgi:DNA polymerase-3 subunit gamma/tau
LSQHKVSHAYLFCGPRGTGKTTVAKLVAKSVNCTNLEKTPCNECDNCIEIQQGNHPDVIEIDAASNNGVDQIRELIEKVKYAPLQAKFKVYIIDEVHMLSQGAFNALLKTLEEPPSHVIFILATTEPHKVLPTIISRCQRYDFTRVSQKDIQGRIEEVLTKENIKFDHEATRLISQLSDGGVRDALSILEQVIAYSEDNLTAQHVNDIYGIATTQDKLKLLKAIQNQDVAILMEEIESITQKNIDIRRLTNDLMELLKESVIYSYTKDAKLLMKLTTEEAKDLNVIPSPIALKMIDDLMETTEKYRSASDVLSYFEIGLLKLIGHLNAPISQSASYQQDPIKNEKPKAVKVEKEIKVEPLIIEKSIQKEPELVVEKEIFVEKPTPIELEKEVKIVPQGDALSFDLNVEEVKPSKKLKNIELNDDFILQLLLSAEKQLRIKDSQNWETVKNHKGDMRYMKVANMVDESTIQASGSQFNLITFENKLKVSTVNELNNIDDLAKLTKEVLGRETRLYALSLADYERVRDLFIQYRNEGKLPEKQDLEFFPKKAPKSKKENQTLINAEILFDGNFSAIGESED